MTNLEKYNGAFVETFGAAIGQLGDGFTSDTVENWDSVTHMTLIAALEDAYDILIGTDDVFEFTSYGRGKEILRKYEVEI